MKHALVVILFAALGCGGQDVSTETENVDANEEAYCSWIPTVLADQAAGVSGNQTIPMTGPGWPYAGRSCPYLNMYWVEYYITTVGGPHSATFNFDDTSVFKNATSILNTTQACQDAHITITAYTGTRQVGQPAVWDQYIGSTQLHGWWNGFVQQCQFVYDAGFVAIPTFDFGNTGGFGGLTNDVALFGMSAFKGITSPTFYPVSPVAVSTHWQ